MLGTTEALADVLRDALMLTDTLSETLGLNVGEGDRVDDIVVVEDALERSPRKRSSDAMVALPLLTPVTAPWLPMPTLPLTFSECAIATDASTAVVALKSESSASAVVSARVTTA